MEIIVTKDIVKVNMDNDIHKGEYKINTCEFTFSDDYTQDLVKVAVFTRTDKTTYRVVIENDECDIPYEVLNSKGSIVIGVYAYKVNGEELQLRYSPRPVLMAVQDGSYIENTEESSIYIPASTIEEYEQQLQDLLADVEASKDEIIEEVTQVATNEALQEVDDYIDQFVKVRVSGENINVQDSSNLPIKDFKLKGNANGTVTGDVTVKVVGKNLAWWYSNTNNWATDFVARVNDSSKASIVTYENRNCLKFYPSAGAGSYDTKYLFKTQFKENTRYTFKFDKYSSGYWGDIGIFYTDGTEQELNNLTANAWNSVVLTSQANKTIKYLKVHWRNNYDQYIDLDTFMVYEGTGTQAYEPYTEQTQLLSLGNIALFENDIIEKINNVWCVNNITILDTTLIGQLENIPNLHTYKNTTNIFSTVPTGNVEPVYEITYIQDLETRLNNIEARQDNIEARLSLLE